MNHFMKHYLSANSGSFIFLILFLLKIGAFGSDHGNKYGYSGFPDTTSVNVTCQTTLDSEENLEGILLTLTEVNMGPVPVTLSNFCTLSNPEGSNELPFLEDFDTGLFQTNNWTVDGDNWRIAGQAGDPQPSAEFYFNPVNENYSMSLTSDFLNGTGIMDRKIYLSFSLKHTTVVPTGKEKLAIEVFDGETWNLISEHISISDLNWFNQTSDITQFAMGKMFRIRFRAHGELTTDIFNWLIDNIRIYRSCAPPYNIEALPDFWEGVLLSWEDPSGNPGNSSWIFWDDGTNNDAIGLPYGGTFSVASRYTPAQLAEYTGGSLTRIRMFPYGPNGTLTLKVWIGPDLNTLTLIHTQPVPSYVAGQWNEFLLTTPVAITGATELWFGYEVTHTDTGFVAGIDNGPAVAGFGDMISIDGTDWDSMANDYGFNFNWNLQGYVESVDRTSTYIGNASIKDGSEPDYRNSSSLLQRELVSYAIYREGEYIATTEELSYFDPCSELGIGLSVGYGVKAIYEDCESVFVYTLCRNYCPGVGVTYKKSEDIKIYPNPSAGLIYIDNQGLSGTIMVYSFSGEELHKADINKNEKPVLSLENYPQGAYLIKFVSDSGETFTGKAIMVK